MPLRLSDLTTDQVFDGIDIDVVSSNVVAAEVPISPNPAIELKADDVEEGIVEVATDIHAINDMPSLTVMFQNAIS